jgi:hypothetical protein
LAYPFQNQAINNEARNLNDAYLECKLQRKSTDRASMSALFGMDMLCSQYRKLLVYAPTIHVHSAHAIIGRMLAMPLAVLADTLQALL